MTAAHQWGAAYAMAGLSVRVSELHALDVDDVRDWFVPAQRTSTP